MTARRRIDIVVGQRMSDRRLRLGLSEGQLAAAVGVRAEDLAHYEAGRKHVSAAVLYQLAVALGVPISYFFSDLRSEAPDEPPEPVPPPS
ncbi:MAG: helix-turn-helix transcriptional regulator [Alphaproteobacteria bacterium]|nr:helix-turn-helix transcriptional regulator [Alphaproteobacteria bacterium]